MPTLSVICPAYNEENIITAFLESIAAQTWCDFEFVIVDDASTDQTADLIEAYLPQLKCPKLFVRHEKNMGEGATIAEAFSKTTGNFVLKMDADSLIAPDTFTKLMDAFTNDEQAGIISAYQTSIDHSNWVVRGAEVVSIAYQRTGARADGHEHAHGICLAFRRHIFSTQELASRTDVDLSWLARKRGWKIILLNDVTIRSRIPSTLSWTFSRGRRDARQVLPNYWHHKEKLLTRWGFWARFTPLGLAFIALFKPLWALAGLLGWMIALQIFLYHQAPDYPLRDRLAATGVVLVSWIGFNTETLLIVARAIVNMPKIGKRLQ